MVEKDRAERLAAALQDNLKRRKAQARAKTADPTASSSDRSSSAESRESRGTANETATKRPKSR